MPGLDGRKLLDRILAQDALATVVMITGQGDETVAVDMMKAGAQNYLSKDTIPMPV